MPTFLSALIPMVFALIGGFVAAIYRPKKQMISSLQHFTAGIVIAAVAIELLPKILAEGASYTVAIGFIIGAGLMLFLKWFFSAVSDVGGPKANPIGLITASAIDLLIDGMLISVSFLAGRKSGLLIAFSLSFCAFFLNMTVGTTLLKQKNTVFTRYFAIVIIAVMLPIGAFVGENIISYLPPIIIKEIIAFGVAALLYLGVEELLADVHKEDDTQFTSACFFLGFFCILLLTLIN